MKQAGLSKVETGLDVNSFYSPGFIKKIDKFPPEEDSFKCAKGSFLAREDVGEICRPNMLYLHKLTHLRSKSYPLRRYIPVASWDWVMASHFR